MTCIIIIKHEDEDEFSSLTWSHSLRLNSEAKDLPNHLYVMDLSSLMTLGKGNHEKWS